MGDRSCKRSSYWQRLKSVGRRLINEYRFKHCSELTKAQQKEKSWRRPPTSETGEWKQVYDNAETEQQLKALVKKINEEFQKYPTIPPIPEPPLFSETDQRDRWSTEWTTFHDRELTENTQEAFVVEEEARNIQGTDQLDLERFVDSLTGVALTVEGFQNDLQESSLPTAVPTIPGTTGPISGSGGGDGGNSCPKRPRLNENASTSTAPAPLPGLWAQMMHLHEALDNHYEGGSNHPQLQPSALQGSDKVDLSELRRILNVILYEGGAAVRGAPLNLSPPSPRLRGGKRRLVQQLREVVERLYKALGYGAPY
jgi:hypothetical protein